MGASHSTRRVSIENDGDPSTLIKVSDAVVERLKSMDDLDEDKGQAVRKPPRVRVESQNQPPPGGFNYPPYITSLQLKQELENELQKNNDYWENRLRELQANQEAMNRLIEMEYAKAVDEMEKKLPKKTDTLKETPCVGAEQLVLGCYKKNSKKPLLCAKQVDEFTKCMVQYSMMQREPAAPAPVC